MWDAVQQRLADNGPERQANRKVEASPLVGKLFDEAGERLTPSHTVKNGRRYRYYISRPLGYLENEVAEGRCLAANLLH